MSCRISKVKFKDGRVINIIRRANESEVVEQILKGAQEARNIKATSMGIVLAGAGGWISTAFVDPGTSYTLIGAIEDLKSRVQNNDGGGVE